MKYYFITFALLVGSYTIYAQPCSGSADGLPGKYTDHTQTKYGPSSLGNYSVQEKAAMTKQMIALEKIEEASRTNFQLTGCFARVSFSATSPSSYGSYPYASYEYQLGIYQNVCHVTQHIVKTVDEYRSVLRVDINPALSQPGLKPGPTGEFYLTDKEQRVRYEIPLTGRISQYFSESMVLANRSNDYKNKHQDFLKIINGDGYTENYLSSSKYDKVTPTSYRWIDRRYLITRPGVPLLIPVSRKQYLEDLLEYFETEKVNFYSSLEKQIKDASGSNNEYAKKKLVVLTADKQAYPQFYEQRKAKVQQLLATQKPEWLQKIAVVNINSYSYDANKRLADIGKFYDEEDEKTAALYVYNPEYFKRDNVQSTTPVLIEVAFRYELRPDAGYSARLFANFEKNYDLDALHKMLR